MTAAPSTLPPNPSTALALPAPPPQAPRRQKGLLEDLVEGALWGLAIAGGVLLLDELFSSRSAPARLPRAPARRRMTRAEAEALQREAQLEENRGKGRRFERAVERTLEDAFPGSEVFRQVSVTTPEGSVRRVDHVVRDADGTVTAFESKNVLRLQPKHVRQVKEQHAALKHHGLPVSERPALAVPMKAVVSETLTKEVHVYRVKQRRTRR
jgi:hypothetical protein